MNKDRLGLTVAVSAIALFVVVLAMQAEKRAVNRAIEAHAVAIATPAAEVSAAAPAAPRVVQTHAHPRKAPARRPTPEPTPQLYAVGLHRSIRQLLSAYPNLRSRIVVIIDLVANGASSDQAIADGGGQWYNDERGFQSQIDALPADQSDGSQYRLLKGNLAESETFLYSAGADAMSSCDAPAAERDLEVADYFFRTVKNEINTGVVSPDDGGNPPDAGSSHDLCSSP